MHSLSNDNTKDLDDFSEHKDETIYEASNIDSNEGSTSFAMSTSKVSSPNSSFPDEADLDVLQDEDDGNPENSILGWDLLDDVRPTKLNRVFKGGSGWLLSIYLLFHDHFIAIQKFSNTSSLQSQVLS